MRNNYRETKNDLISCPFNPNHKVKRCRLITHKKICPDKEIKGFVLCPFNPNHHVALDNLENHKDKCPNKVLINSDLEKEMEDFIKSKRNEKVITKFVVGEVKNYEENFENNQNKIEGLKTKKKKKKTKKSKKENKNITKNEEIKEKSIDLENMTNKELFNFIFNDNMVIEYHSDSSENNDEDGDYKKNSQKNEE